MAWNDTKNEQDLISNTDWNDHVSVTMQTSGAFWAHSSNSNIHFTKSSIDTVGTITTGTWNATPISQSYIKSGSQYYQGYLHSANSNIHLTPSQKSDLTDGGDSTLHYHASDRNLSNATGILSISHGGTNNSSYTSDKFVIYDGSKLTSSSYDSSSFASTAHTHDASDITSGVLSTDRFSAYDDLVAENKIGSSDNQIASGTHTHNNLYYTKTETNSLYYPSSLGAALSGSYHSHILDASAHHSRYTNEEAQDAVGAILDDGSLGEIIFTYDDNTPKIYGVVQDSEIDHNQLSNTHNLTSDIDHGSISGLDDDDHPQYYNQDRITTISSNAVSGQQAKTWLNASGSKYNIAYQHSQITTGNPHNIDLSDIGETKGDLIANSPLSFSNTRQVLGGSTTISISQAGPSTDGYLTSSDWNTFNSKQDSFTFGTLSNGTGIQTFSVGISGTSSTISVLFGKTNTTVASGSHIHDDRYYTESEADNNFYPSSLGHNHVSNSNIHFTKSSINLNDLGDTNVPSPTSGNSLVWNGSNWIDKHISGSTSYWNPRTGGIYYENEVTIGHSAFDVGNYKLQVSGNTYFSGQVHFKGNQISGLAQPLYPSSATSKSYVDSNFYPSSLGHNHVNDSSIHFAKSSIYLNDLSDTSIPSPTSGNSLVWNGTNWIDKTVTGGSSYWSSRTGGIYYDGEVTIGPSDFDLGDFNLQVSGNTYLSGQTYFKGSQISGLAQPLYPSSATSKSYVDSSVQSLLTFSLASVRISANQNINLAKFTTPSNKYVYVWQASASDIQGNTKGGLYVQILSGSSSLYSTSSSTIQQGTPLASGSGKIEVRFVYSGSGITGYASGSCFMSLSVM